MRPIRTFWRSANNRQGAPTAAGEYPTPHEVLGEIGLLLAIHLAAAFAIAATLRWFGIA
ncbi:MAG: hypothetical protein ISP49_13865 [Reyranella sp.]|nr:hypothetical protein [Reyranella sp.]MBL6652678.1 hypothetical protein [Reyranella sp.]